MFTNNKFVKYLLFYILFFSNQHNNISGNLNITLKKRSLSCTKKPAVKFLLQVRFGGRRVTGVERNIHVGAYGGHVIVNAQSGDLGSLVRAQRVLTQKSYTNIDHNQSDAGSSHPYIRVIVQLDDDPGACYGRTNTRDHDSRAAPMFRGETLVPLEFAVLANFVFVLAHFAP